MVDFSDEPGQFTQQSFYDLFFGNNPTGNFADYFKENSYGKLRYTGDVVALNSNQVTTNSNTISYVRLPNPKSFYANGNGGVIVNDFPRNAAGVYLHTIQALDNAGFNFAPYADADGILHNAIIIFAGRSGSESSNLNDLNAQHYSIKYATSGGYKVKDGTLLKNFSLCPEREAIGQARIGLCTHEQGHALGLPDLYDHTYKKSALAYMDLMAAGTFGGHAGKRPFHLSAFSKMKLGWLTPTTPAAGQLLVSLPPVETQPVALKLAPYEGSPEYFLVENRQKLGFDDLFEQRGLCYGAIISHINESTYSQYLLTNRVNTDPSLDGPSTPSVSIVEQDGDSALLKLPLNYGVCGDTYQTGTVWNDSTPGNSKLWDGTSTGLKLAVGPKDANQAIDIYFYDLLKGKIKLTLKKTTIEGKLSVSNPQTGLVAELRKKNSSTLLKSVAVGANQKFKFTRIKPGSYKVTIRNLNSTISIKKR